MQVQDHVEPIVFAPADQPGGIVHSATREVLLPIEDDFFDPGAEGDADHVEAHARNLIDVRLRGPRVSVLREGFVGDGLA
ncbi:hypothetical protein E4U21_007808 [Claviceps maximensis]|nr:hypothetical protein E4U21_007808 [Claviceps maximensis]